MTRLNARLGQVCATVKMEQKTLFQISNLEELKSKIKKIDFGNDDETEKERIEKIYRTANKTSVDWASLFVSCYEQLSGIDYQEIKDRLNELKDIYIKINYNLEEYNQPMEYGKHTYRNKLMKLIHENIGAVKEVVDFTFTKILYEADMGDDYEITKATH